MANFKKLGLLIKIVTVLTAVSLLYSNILWAQGGSISLHRAIDSLPSFTFKDTFSNLNIPENLGKVKEIWKNESTENNKIILHIQDSHANYEAQTNIAKILEHIINTYKKDLPKNIKNHYRSNGNNNLKKSPNTPPILIAVEGAKGGIDTSMFYKIPVMEVRDMLADFFMEEGIINGAEYFDAMTRDKYKNPPFLVWGVEDKETYIDNVRYFKKVHESKGPVQEFVKEHLYNISQIIAKRWNEDQKEYFDIYYKYQDDEIGLEEYAVYLNFKLQTSNFKINPKRPAMAGAPIPNFMSLTKLLELKNQIEFEKIEAERIGLLKVLKEKMAEEDFVRLITEGLHYQIGNNSVIDYFLNQEELMNEYGISGDGFKNLCLYFRYIEVENKIDRKLLFKEIRDIEQEIVDNLFNKDEERTLFDEVYRVIILKKFTELKIYREDLQYYKEHRVEFAPEGKMKIFLNSFEKFCDLGIKRDHILVENMLAKMAEIGIDKAILITGGFHTEGMTELLKQKKANYAVISPKMIDNGDKNKYIQLVLNKKNILEKVLAFTGTRLAIASALSEVLLGDCTPGEIEEARNQLLPFLVMWNEGEKVDILDSMEKIRKDLDKRYPKSTMKKTRLSDIESANVVKDEEGLIIGIILEFETEKWAVGTDDFIEQFYCYSIKKINKTGINIAQIHYLKGEKPKIPSKIPLGIKADHIFPEVGDTDYYEEGNLDQVKTATKFGLGIISIIIAGTTHNRLKNKWWLSLFNANIILSLTFAFLLLFPLSKKTEAYYREIIETVTYIVEGEEYTEEEYLEIYGEDQLGTGDEYSGFEEGEIVEIEPIELREIFDEELEELESYREFIPADDPFPEQPSVVIIEIDDKAFPWHKPTPPAITPKNSEKKEFISILNAYHKKADNKKGTQDKDIFKAISDFIKFLGVFIDTLVIIVNAIFYGVILAIAISMLTLFSRFKKDKYDKGKGDSSIFLRRPKHKPKPFSITQHWVATGISMLVAMLPEILGPLDIILTISPWWFYILAIIWGSSFLFAGGLANLVKYGAERIKKDRFEIDKDIESQIYKTIEKYGQGINIEFTDLNENRVAEYDENTNTVRFAKWLVAQDNRTNSWFNRLRKVLLPLVLAHEITRIRCRLTPVVFALKPLTMLHISGKFLRGITQVPSPVGRCVTGDTLLPVLRLAEEFPISNLQSPNKSQIPNLNFQNKPIVDVAPGDYVLSLNEKTQKIEPHRINGLLDMGIKPVYRLTTATGRSIKTTVNHPYLTRQGWVKVSGLKAGDEIGVPGVNTLQNFSRINIKQSYSDVVTSICGLTNLDSNGGGGAKSSTSTSNMGWLGSCCDRAISNIHLLNSELPFSWKTTWALLGTFISGCAIMYLSNSHPNVLCISQNISLLIISYLLIKQMGMAMPSTAIITVRDNELSNFLHKPAISLSNNDDTIFPASFGGDNNTVISKLSSIFTGSVAEAAEIGGFQGALLWDRIVSIDYIGYEHVYDIEVEGTHNFIGNGIFAHNTYMNLESLSMTDQSLCETGNLDELAEILSVHNKAWKGNRDMQFTEPQMNRLIEKGLVYVLKIKKGIKGVLLTYPMNTGGDLSRIEELSLWQNMMNGRIEEADTNDTRIFWAIGTIEKGLGDIFIREAKQYFKDTPYICTFSPVKGYEEFVKELQYNGLADDFINEYGIYLYLMSVGDEGHESYLDYIRENGFILPDEYFRGQNKRPRDNTEGFHIRNGAVISRVLLKKPGYTRPDSAYTIIYGYKGMSSAEIPNFSSVIDRLQNKGGLIPGLRSLLERKVGIPIWWNRLFVQVLIEQVTGWGVLGVFGLDAFLAFITVWGFIAGLHYLWKGKGERAPPLLDVVFLVVENLFIYGLFNFILPWTGTLPAFDFNWNLVGFGSGGLAHSILNAYRNTNLFKKLTKQLGSGGSDELCVTGDTLLPILSAGEIQNPKTVIPAEAGIQNSKTGFRVKPGMTLIPIVDVKPGDYVLSLNEETQQIEPHRINGLLDMGIKPVYRLTTASGRSIKTTANHPYLTRRGWIKVSGLKAGDEIACPEGLSFGEVPIDSIIDQPSFNFSRNSFGVTMEMLWKGFNISKSISFVTIKSAFAVIAVSKTILSFGSLHAMILLFGLTTFILRLTEWKNLLTIPDGILNLGRERTSANSNNICLDVTSSKLPFINASYNSSLTLLPINALANTLVSTTALVPAMMFSSGIFTDRVYFSVSNPALSGMFPHLHDYMMCFRSPQVFFKIIQNMQLILWLEGIYNLPYDIDINTYSISHSLFLLFIYENNNTTILLNRSRLFSISETEALEVNSAILWDQIVSIDYLGYEHVYDIEVEGTHNFIGNGIFAHNTYFKKRKPESNAIIPGLRKIVEGVIGEKVDYPTSIGPVIEEYGLGTGGGFYGSSERYSKIMNKLWETYKNAIVKIWEEERRGKILRNILRTIYTTILYAQYFMGFRTVPALAGGLTGLLINNTFIYFALGGLIGFLIARIFFVLAHEKWFGALGVSGISGIFLGIPLLPIIFGVTGQALAILFASAILAILFAPKLVHKWWNILYKDRSDKQAVIGESIKTFADYLRNKFRWSNEKMSKESEAEERWNRRDILKIGLSAVFLKTLLAIFPKKVNAYDVHIPGVGDLNDQKIEFNKYSEGAGSSKEVSRIMSILETYMMEYVKIYNNLIKSNSIEDVKRYTQEIKLKQRDFVENIIDASEFEPALCDFLGSDFSKSGPNVFNKVMYLGLPKYFAKKGIYMKVVNEIIMIKEIQVMVIKNIYLMKIRGKEKVPVKNPDGTILEEIEPVMINSVIEVFGPSGKQAAAIMADAEVNYSTIFVFQENMQNEINKFYEKPTKGDLIYLWCRRYTWEQMNSMYAEMSEGVIKMDPLTFSREKLAALLKNIYSKDKYGNAYKQLLYMHEYGHIRSFARQRADKGSAKNIREQLAAIGDKIDADVLNALIVEDEIDAVLSAGIWLGDAQLWLYDMLKYYLSSFNIPKAPLWHAYKYVIDELTKMLLDKILHGEVLYQGKIIIDPRLDYSPQDQIKGQLYKLEKEQIRALCKEMLEKRGNNITKPILSFTEQSIFEKLLLSKYKISGIVVITGIVYMIVKIIKRKMAIKVPGRKGPEKGVIRWLADNVIFKYLGIDVTKPENRKIKNAIEDSLIPLIEEGIMYGIGLLGGIWGYVIARAVFVLINLFQKQDTERTWWQRIALPLFMSLAAISPWIFAWIDPMAAAGAIPLSLVFGLGALSHILSNIYVDIAGSRLQKGVAGGRDKNFNNILEKFLKEIYDNESLEKDKIFFEIFFYKKFEKFIKNNFPHAEFDFRHYKDPPSSYYRFRNKYCKDKESARIALLRLNSLYNKYIELIMAVNKRIREIGLETIKFDGVVFVVKDGICPFRNISPIQQDKMRLEINIEYLYSEDNNIFAIGDIAHEAGHGLVLYMSNLYSRLEENEELAANWAANWLLSKDELKKFISNQIEIRRKSDDGSIYPHSSAQLLALATANGLEKDFEILSQYSSSLAEAYYEYYNNLEWKPGVVKKKYNQDEKPPRTGKVSGDDSRGWEGLPNDEYADDIREAIGVDEKEGVDCIKDLLRSSNPNEVGKYKEKGVKWEDECNANGRITFNWTDEDGTHSVNLSTGKGAKGKVRVFLGWDNELGYYVFRTERELEGELIISYSRFEKDAKGNWKIRQFKPSWKYPDRKSVIDTLQKRREQGLENDPYHLQYGRQPDIYLLEAARRFNVKLDELTILDREYNRESEIVSIRRAGQDKFVKQTEEDVLDMIQVLIAGLGRERGDTNKETMPAIIDMQIALLMYLYYYILFIEAGCFPRDTYIEEVQHKLGNEFNIRRIEGLLDSLNGNGHIPIMELLGLKEPVGIKEEDIRNSIEFFNKDVEKDLYQNAEVRLSIHPDNRVVLIQGGHGSGKSTSLAETICQMVKQGKKILLAAHDNSALDTVLERLDSLGVPILRATGAHNETELVEEGKVSSDLWDYCTNNKLEPQFSKKGEREFKRRLDRFGGMVLGTTVDTSLINRAVRDFDADIVTLDEAGLCDTIDTLLVSLYAKEKVVIVGDHKQLPPYFREEEYRGYNEAYKDLKRESYLARIWNRGYSKVFLARNYRSHPLIAFLVSLLFYDRLMVPKPWTFMEEDTIRIVDVPMGEGVGNEREIDLEGGQWFQKKRDLANYQEAKKCIEEYERVIQSGYPASEITIITGYEGQVEEIRNLLRIYLEANETILNGGEGIEEYLERHVITINKSQGRESGVVIMSFVRSNPEPYKVGFMKNLLRMNIALSRAKDRLVLVGDMVTLCNAAETEGDKVFANKFRKLLDLKGNEYASLGRLQAEIGGFTIHEAIQEANAYLNLSVLKKQNGVRLNKEVLEKLHKGLMHMDSRTYNRVYNRLELLHEASIVGLSRREEPVYSVKEDEYDEVIDQLKEIARKFLNIIKIGAEGDIKLLWLEDEKKKPIIVQVIKEVGVTVRDMVDGRLDTRGWEGLPNEEYTDNIRKAIGVDADGNKIAGAKREFVCVEYNPKAGEFEVSKFRYDKGEAEFGELSISDSDMELLNEYLMQLDLTDYEFLTEPDIYTGKRAQILFMPSQSGHYGISRNQYYLGIDLMNQPELLKSKLHHEAQERMAVVTHEKYKEWMENRGKPGVEEAISRVAKEKHKELRMQRDLSMFILGLLVDKERAIDLASFLPAEGVLEMKINLLRELALTSPKTVVENWIRKGKVKNFEELEDIYNNGVNIRLEEEQINNIRAFFNECIESRKNEVRVFDIELLEEGDLFAIERCRELLGEFKEYGKERPMSLMYIGEGLRRESEKGIKDVEATEEMCTKEEQDVRAMLKKLGIKDEEIPDNLKIITPISIKGAGGNTITERIKNILSQDNTYAGKEISIFATKKNHGILFKKLIKEVRVSMEYVMRLELSGKELSRNLIRELLDVADMVEAGIGSHEAMEYIDKLLENQGIKNKGEIKEAVDKYISQPKVGEEVTDGIENEKRNTDTAL